MDALINLFTQNIAAFSIAAAVAIAVTAYIAIARFNLWVRDFWATFPVIGTIARLSRDNTKSPDGWYRAEETLCAVYAPFAEVVGQDEFRNSTMYLRKSTDLGRSPTPFGVWALLVLLVIAEGLGFSYLLGQWMAREGSANTHTLLMVAIVLVLCAILVAITHKAGSQYRRTNLLRSCFKRYKELGAQEYSSDAIDLDSDQSKDDNQPGYKQILNRVAEHPHDKGSYMAMWVAVISIAVIAILSTVMRYQNLQSERALINMETSVSAPAAVASSGSSNPFGFPVPGEVSEPNNEARQYGEKEAADAHTIEGLSAFLMLAFIFIITQIVGIGAGYKYSFAGAQSKDAYKVTKGFATHSEYFRSVKPINDLASGRLKELQQKLEEKSHQRMDLSHTFNDYLARAKKQSQELINGTSATDKPKDTITPTKSDNTPPTIDIAAANSGVQAPSEPAKPSTSGTDVDQTFIATVISDLEALDDLEAENAYYQSLATNVKIHPQVLSWRKARKEQSKLA